ncbi:MAG TPA: four helix bundle protein [Bacteroidia bacterium]|nr:four helix bundle protein [Bacteroidia bacterium]
MASIKRFEDIVAWQKARDLSKKIYKISSTGTLSKDIGLREQARRSSVSIMANIAEGYERKTDKEFVRFLNISKGSLAELKSHLYLAKEVDYITVKLLNELLSECDEISKILSGLINYLKKERTKKRNTSIHPNTKPIDSRLKTKDSRL